MSGKIFTKAPKPASTTPRQATNPVLTQRPWMSSPLEARPGRFPARDDIGLDPHPPPAARPHPSPSPRPPGGADFDFSKIPVFPPDRSGVPSIPGRNRIDVAPRVRLDNTLAPSPVGRLGANRIVFPVPLQAKLTVGLPNDPDEQEADQMAGAVMRMPEPSLQRQGKIEHEEGDKEITEKDAIQAKPPAKSIIPWVQRQAAVMHQADEAKPDDANPEEEESIQAKRYANTPVSPDPKLASLIIRQQRQGHPLSPATRAFFEPRFGRDFGDVRIHADGPSAEAAKSIQAQAFTHMQDIYFGKGHYQPQTGTGKTLLAHELTHTIQQQGAGPRMQRQVAAEIPTSAQPTPVVPGTTAATPAPATPTQTEADATPRNDQGGGVLGWVAEQARNIPGYQLLGLILGRDPISGETVERNAANLIRAVIGLLPGGTLIQENLNKTGAIDRAGTWLDQKVAGLGLSWGAISGMFSHAWAALSLSDKLLPWRAFTKIKGVFTPILTRVVKFAKAAGNKLLEFVLEGALKLAGPFGTQVMAVLKKAGGVFTAIIKDPIGFLKNLSAAVQGGFTRFKDNILTHLKTGLVDWLFGALAGAGLQLPEKFDLKGVLSLTLQLMGATYTAVRQRLVKRLGEPLVERVEKTVSFVADIARNGLSAAWEMLTGFIGNLKDRVVGAIQNWVVTQVVTTAITKLVTLFNPAGALLEAGKAIYTIITFFIDRAQQLAALGQAVFASIGRIASGAVGGAIGFIEQAMARSLSIMIGFLARWLGLGKVSQKIKDIIQKIRAPVEKAMTKLVGFIVKKARALVGRGKAPAGKKPTTQAEHDQQVKAGLAALHREEEQVDKDKDKKLTFEEANTVAKRIKKRFPVFSVFKVIDGGTRWDYDYVASPGKVKKGRVKAKISRAPKWDWGHIIERHHPSGQIARDRLAAGGSQAEGVFQGVTPAGLKRIVRGAWKNRKRIDTQVAPDGSETVVFKGWDSASGVWVKFWQHDDGRTLAGRLIGQ